MAHPVFSEGRVAVVTGAASGIGLAAAKRFASLGMKVCLADIDAVALDEASEEVSKYAGEAIAVATDVSDRDSIASLKAQVDASLGPTALLMNNAVTRIGGGVWGDESAALPQPGTEGTRRSLPHDRNRKTNTTVRQ